MSDDSPIGSLLAPMADRAVDLEGDAYKVDRAAVLARMASVSRPSRPRWPAYAGALAAAIVALAIMQAIRQGSPSDVGARSEERFEVFVPTGSEVQFRGESGRDETIAGKTVLGSNGALETGPASSARVTTADGVGIELQGETSVSVEALRTRDSRLSLARGAVRCSVAHRDALHPFRVVAPEVTFVDLGTVFSVKIDAATHATLLVVEEGEVLVQRGNLETTVKAPGQWSTLDPSAAIPPIPVPADAVPPSSLQPKHAATTREPRAGRAPAAPTTLDDESRLLREGLAAERQGRAAEAASLLERLLARYPKSPLAPDAREALRRAKQNAP